MIVEKDPAQDLAPLVGVDRAELAEPFGQIIEDDARLGEALAGMLEDGHLAHDVDCPESRRAGFAVEVIDEPRLPVGAAEIEHQGGLVGIARLGEAVEQKLGHGHPPVSRVWRTSNMVGGGAPVGRGLFLNDG